MQYITSTTNQLKLDALKSAVAKESVTVIEAEGMPNVIPLFKEDARLAAGQGVNAIVRSILSKEDYRDRKEITAVCLQKFVTVYDKGDPYLGCIVAVRRADTTFFVLGECEFIPLAPKIKTLVNEGVALYDAYAQVYGEAIKNKTQSLYELLEPGKFEANWMADGIKKTLLKLE